MVTGAERLTVTTWLEGTWVAPWAGVVETTVRGARAVVAVTAAPPALAVGSDAPVW